MAAMMLMLAKLMFHSLADFTSFCNLLGPKTSLCMWLTLEFVFTHISYFLYRFNDDY